MKFIIVLAVVMTIAGAHSRSDGNRRINIEALFGNPEELHQFIGCLLDVEPCDAAAGDFKEILPEAFNTACANCTKTQKHLLKRYLAELEVRLPQQLQAFLNKYDPQGKFFPALHTALANF